MDGSGENINKAALARLLDQRYGDGQIYLTDANERAVLKAAVNMGLVSKDGYLTHSGRRFWANHSVREIASHHRGRRPIFGITQKAKA